MTNHTDQIAAACCMLREAAKQFRATGSGGHAAMCEAHANGLSYISIPVIAGLWHDDIGPVLWWKFPVDEPPFCGTPFDSDWRAYYTHWTPIVVPAAPTPNIIVTGTRAPTVEE